MSATPINPLPQVVADGPLSDAILELLQGNVELVAWEQLQSGRDESIDGIYTYGHPLLTGALMDNAPNVKVISNFGVGVDHIEVQDARERGIPVGNTPGVLDGATADMGFGLLMASARRLSEGERYVRGLDGANPLHGQMLGREIHGARLGIIGMGRIGLQVARRATGFDMDVSYHNRTRRPDAESELGLRYQSLVELLKSSDYIMLCVPLTPQTAGMIGEPELRLMQPTATLINIARGAVVNTDALTKALQERWIYSAGLDVTEPEPLPCGHPLLAIDNVVITPHLGSATVQTRRAMSELSVRNLLAGLAGEPLLHKVV